MFTLLSILQIAPALPAQEQRQAIDAYIIFGQSNANGRSYGSELSNEALRHHYGENLLYAYRERSWQNGSRPVEIPLGKIQPDSRDRIGVEVTLGRHLAAHSSRPVMLVKFCSGGTSIKNFLPETNNLFQPMLSFLREKKQEAGEFGYQVNWAGAFVITGESDSTEPNASMFRDRFLTVKNALESELGVTSLPVTYSLLRGNWIDTPASKYSRFNQPATTINEAMSALAESDPNIRVTPSNADLSTRFEKQQSKTDGIHYSSDSYARLGVRLYHTAFPDRAPLIDRNADGQCDVWEAKHATAKESPDALRDKKLSSQPIDSDDDGISDWAENQLAGFDAANSDSFDIGEPFSDLPILLSKLDGTKPRQSDVSTIWQPDSPTHTTGTLGNHKVDWTGPQHETTTANAAVVTTNASKKSVTHSVTFDPPVKSLSATVWGISKKRKIDFDASFSILENPDGAEQIGQAIVGNPKSDSRVTIQFDESVSTLSITEPGNDAIFFRFLTEVQLPGEPLEWRH